MYRYIPSLPDLLPHSPPSQAPRSSQSIGLSSLGCIAGPLGLRSLRYTAGPLGLSSLRYTAGPTQAELPAVYSRPTRAELPVVYSRPTRVELPAVCSRPTSCLLCIWGSLYGNPSLRSLPPCSPCPVSACSFFVSASLSLPCTQVHLHRFSGFRILPL